MIKDKQQVKKELEKIKKRYQTKLEEKENLLLEIKEIKKELERKTKEYDEFVIKEVNNGTLLKKSHLNSSNFKEEIELLLKRHPYGFNQTYLYDVIQGNHVVFPFKNNVAKEKVFRTKRENADGFFLVRTNDKHFVVFYNLKQNERIIREESVFSLTSNRLAFLEKVISYYEEENKKISLVLDNNLKSTNYFYPDFKISITETNALRKEVLSDYTNEYIEITNSKENVCVIFNISGELVLVEYEDLRNIKNFKKMTEVDKEELSQLKLKNEGKIEILQSIIQN